MTFLSTRLLTLLLGLSAWWTSGSLAGSLAGLPTASGCSVGHGSGGVQDPGTLEDPAGTPSPARLESAEADDDDQDDDEIGRSPGTVGAVDRPWVRRRVIAASRRRAGVATPGHSRAPPAG